MTNHLAFAAFLVDLRQNDVVDSAITHEALARLVDVASALPPRTPFPNAAIPSFMRLCSILDIVAADGDLECGRPYLSNAVLLQLHIGAHANRRDVFRDLLDTLVSVLAALPAPDHFLTPKMIADGRALAKRAALA